MRTDVSSHAQTSRVKNAVTSSISGVEFVSRYRALRFRYLARPKIDFVSAL